MYFFKNLVLSLRRSRYSELTENSPDLVNPHTKIFFYSRVGLVLGAALIATKDANGFL
jgi:hypothetical protein